MQYFILRSHAKTINDEQIMQNFKTKRIRVQQEKPASAAWKPVL